MPKKNSGHFFREIERYKRLNLVRIKKGDLMTRCNYLDSWFDSKSKELDEAESKAKKDLITGDKK